MPAIRIQLNNDLHKRIKMRALQDDTTLQQMVPIALEAYLAKMAHPAQEAQVTKFKPAKVTSKKGDLTKA